MLSIVAGNSVYAFGLMLAAFSFGLATGDTLPESDSYLARACIPPDMP